MILQIVWSATAAAEYDRLPRQIRDRIDAALYRLVAVGQGDVVRLQGTAEPEYRLRVGEYRLRFTRQPGAEFLLVLHVSPRGSAYKR